MHKFYIRMDGDIFGPYTAKGMVELNVMPDIMVTEDSIFFTGYDSLVAIHIDFMFDNLIHILIWLF